MTKLLIISLMFPRFMKLKVTVFSQLHKWGIANDPAVEAERFTEACFIERFGRKRQSQPKQIFMILAYLSSRSVRISVNPWLIKDLRLRKITYEKITFFCKTNPNSKKVK